MASLEGHPDYLDGHPERTPGTTQGCQGSGPSYNLAIFCLIPRDFTWDQGDPESSCICQISSSQKEASPPPPL